MGEEQPVIKRHKAADGSCMFLIAYCQQDKNVLNTAVALATRGENDGN